MRSDALPSSLGAIPPSPRSQTPFLPLFPFIYAGTLKKSESVFCYFACDDTKSKFRLFNHKQTKAAIHIYITFKLKSHLPPPFALHITIPSASTSLSVRETERAGGKGDQNHISNVLCERRILFIDFFHGTNENSLRKICIY